jgi:hypothetical protein
MHEFPLCGEDELPTRREFGRFVATATVLPVALSLLSGTEASAEDYRRSGYVPEDTYPFFTDSDPAQPPERGYATPVTRSDGK